MYAETPGCMYADFGCMSIKRLGACMRKRLGAKYADVGCKPAATFGCKVCGCWVQVYGDVWVHVCGCWVQVCGDVWVQSMRLLSASFITAESLPDSR